MDLGLNEDLALIVGAARGLGRAIAEEFAAQGTQLVLLDRDASVRDTAAQIAPHGDLQVAAHEVDATDFAAVRAAVDEVMGGVDRAPHVVYAAGVGSGQFGFPFWNVDPASWDRVWRVNVLGAVHTAHAMVPHWTRLRRGSLLCISSIAGQIGSQTDPPYSAAKAAVINFAQCAAKDLAVYDVRVNTICPGMIKTELNRSVWQAWHARQPAEGRQSYEDWAREKIERTTPLGRWQNPEDVAAMAVFLASRRAANITGQTVNVDGGMVMHW